MSTASDYQIIPLSSEDLSYYEKQRATGNMACSASSPRHRCLETMVYEASYTYQSSKKTGRRTMARKQFCAKHAKQFAEHHGLELPPPNQPADPPETEAAAKAG